MEAILASLTTKFSPGAVGVSLVALVLLGWWQVLPKFIEAFANRQSKLEERMQVLLDRSTERFQRELAAADERHDACLEGQKRLMIRVEELERGRDEDRKLIAEQTRTIEGLNHKITQMQISALRTDGMVPSPLIKGVMDRLDQMPD